jgi:hypothetical protein
MLSCKETANLTADLVASVLVTVTAFDTASFRLLLSTAILPLHHTTTKYALSAGLLTFSSVPPTTSLTRMDLWKRPVKVVRFLSNLTAFSHLSRIPHPLPLIPPGPPP